MWHRTTRSEPYEAGEPWWKVTRADAWPKFNVAAASGLGVYGFMFHDRAVCDTYSHVMPVDEIPPARR